MINTALLLCLDENKNNLYEDECILAVTKWRTLIHNLKDIDIYIYINKKSNIKLETILKLKKFKNIYFKYYDFFIDYQCLNTLYCQYLFEKEYLHKYDYCIYTDTDLYIQKEIPEYLFQNKNLFLIYNLNENTHLENGHSSIPILYRYLNNKKLNIKSFNTVFIINYLKNNIFAKLKPLMLYNKHKIYFDKYILINTDSYYFEESIYDFGNYLKIINNENSIFLNEELIINNRNLITTTNKTYLFYHKHIKIKKI